LLFAAFRVITATQPGACGAVFGAGLFSSLRAFGCCCKAEFLSIALVLVYVGAVMVLFLFVVMMMDINVENLRSWLLEALSAWPRLSASVIGRRNGGGVDGGLSRPRRLRLPLMLQQTPQHQHALGIRAVYTDTSYPLEVAAAILLVAMIAAIALTLRARKDSKVRTARQTRCVCRARDRVTVVKHRTHPSRARG